jgi:CDP-glycerol glycerophosphotransferase (TagB/SpsB family)
VPDLRALAKRFESHLAAQADVVALDAGGLRLQVRLRGRPKWGKLYLVAQAEASGRRIKRELGAQVRFGVDELGAALEGIVVFLIQWEAFGFVFRKRISARPGSTVRRWTSETLAIKSFHSARGELRAEISARQVDFIITDVSPDGGALAVKYQGEIPPDATVEYSLRDPDSDFQIIASRVVFPTDFASIDERYDVWVKITQAGRVLLEEPVYFPKSPRYFATYELPDGTLSVAYISDTRGTLCFWHATKAQYAKTVAVAENREAYYAQLAAADPDPKTVFFESFIGNAFAGNPKYMLLRMLQRPEFDAFTFYYCCNEEFASLTGSRFVGVPSASSELDSQPAAENDGNGSTNSSSSTEGRGSSERRALALGANKERLSESEDFQGRVHFVQRGTKEYFEALAKSAWWINNVTFPVNWKPFGVKYLNTWHGSPLKRLGFDIEVDGPEVAARHNFFLASRAWDLLLSANHFSTTTFARAFRYAGEIAETGYPCNDILYADNTALIARLRERYQLPEGKKLILYAPTWRDDTTSYAESGVFTLPFDPGEFAAQLGDRYVMLVKMHHLNRPGADALNESVVDVSDTADIMELAALSDVLVTDYSSVFFDYAHSNKPMLFYAYDFEAYAHTIRGLYLDMDTELPGPKLQTQAELFDALARLDEITAQYQEKYADFKAKYAVFGAGGTAADAAIDVLFGRAK